MLAVEQFRLGRWLLRMTGLALVGGAVLLITAFAPQPGQAQGVSVPLMQATSYPAGEDTPLPQGTGFYPPPNESATDTPPAAETSDATFTVTPTPTLPDDLFRTEDAQMQGTRGTPPPSETPGGPTRTAGPSPTQGASPSATPTVIFASASSGPQVNWGFFWVGFALPVLAACAFVLSLIDRQPNFFRRSPKR